MELTVHHADRPMVELVTEEIVLSNLDDALDLIGNISYQGYDRLILHAKNITPEFFDLKTQLAGEVLQKFTNYRLRVCIVGDFSTAESKSLRDFIFESNKGRQVNFVRTVEEAITAFKNKP